MRLEILKTRGMLEDLDDGTRSVGMHDLFREFANSEAKAKAMDLDTQECVYVTHDIAELQQTRIGNCCPKLTRIALGDDMESLEGIQWNYFSNVIVLKLFGCDLANEHLNLAGLKLLQSLDVAGCDNLTQLPGPQELRYFSYLRLVSADIGMETLNQLPVSLNYLHLQGHMDHGRNELNLDRNTNLLELTVERCGESLFMFADLTKLSMPEKMQVCGSHRAHTVKGLSSRLSRLQYLRVVGDWRKPMSCSGLGGLIGLEELHLLLADSTELPDFHRFTNLKKLEILGYNLTRLSGLGSHRKIEQIILKGCKNLGSFETLQQLPTLQLLHVGGCLKLTSIQVHDCVNLTMCLGLSDLTSVEELHLCNVGVSDVPDLKELYLRNVGLPAHVAPQGQVEFRPAEDSQSSGVH